jgi:AcrR family transcriptional regulator
MALNNCTAIFRGEAGWSQQESKSKMRKIRTAQAPDLRELAAVSPARRRRKSREEREPQAKEMILNAAAVVVGEHGYAKATTKRIATQASISEGMIYLYFDSRQAIFDQLLPHFGKAMLSFVRRRVAGSKDVFELEERGFRAFFEFSAQNKGFFRILNEAEVSAPAAHEEHFRMLVEGYMRSFERGVEQGSIENLSSEELDVIIYMLMASRTYLHIRFMDTLDAGKEIPEYVVQTYMRIVRCALKKHHH